MTDPKPPGVGDKPIPPLQRGNKRGSDPGIRGLEAAALKELLAQFVAKGGVDPKIVSAIKERGGDIEGVQLGRMEEFQVGDTIYPLLKLAHTAYFPEDTLFCVLGINGFVGHGSRAQDATKDWQERVHCEFQRLSGKLVANMTAEEKAAWEMMNELIDVPGHRARTPLVYSDFGHLTSVHPHQVTWFGGNRDTIPLGKAHAAFAALRPGQWFKAMIEYGRQDRCIRRLLHVQACDPLDPMTENEAGNFLDSLTTTADLPKAGWDEI